MCPAAHADSSDTGMSSPPASELADPVGPDRSANVTFAHGLLDDELDRREARKEAQESQARAIIVAGGALMTLLLTLAKDAGVFSSDGPVVGRIALVATLVSAAGAALCAVGTIWPRRYERMGHRALVRFNDQAFLDQPNHALVGQVLATRIAIAKTMDDRHETKANWMKWALRLLLGALVGLVIAGGALAIDPPPDKSDVPRIVKGP
jgi:hypothetical protein